ncbi:hypothetical protein LCH29_43095, partial [Streptomyces sp. BRA346]
CFAVRPPPSGYRITPGYTHQRDHHHPEPKISVARKIGPDKLAFYRLADNGMNGAFHLDAAWHHGWETVAALIATAKATAR